jgi:uncharacterized protein (DUF1501 family)
MTQHRQMQTSSRRRFLLSGGATLSLLASGGAWSRATAASSPRRPPLVCLFLRGAADGLSLVVPHGDPGYYSARPSIAIAPPGKPGGALGLDARFGLHPRLAPLHAAYRAGELAIIHAVGSPHPTRSHFEAQDHMETALPGAVADNGWLGRCLTSRDTMSEGAAGSLRAIAFGHSTPLALRGHGAVISAPRLERLRLQAPGALREPLQNAFERMYAAPSSPAAANARDVLTAGRDALTAARHLRELDLARYVPEHDAAYPKESGALREVAALIKADVGLEVAWLDVGGWDTHQNQGTGDAGRLARVLDPWANGLAAFRRDLGARFRDVLVLVMTEFGRTVRENGSGGTDHGHGSVMFLLGGRVRGGAVYGRFPGLSPDALWEGRDLAVTTDFRDVYAEVARHHLRLSALDAILPGHAPGPELGLFVT